MVEALRRSDFTLYRQDDSLFVFHNNWFKDEEVVPNANSTVRTFFVASHKEPEVVVTPNKQSVVVGATITPIEIRVCGNHDAIQITPELPSSLQLIPYPVREESDSNMSGYVVTGCLEKIDTIVFTATLRNDLGATKVEFTIASTGPFRPVF